MEPNLDSTKTRNKQPDDRPTSRSVHLSTPNGAPSNSFEPGPQAQPRFLQAGGVAGTSGPWMLVATQTTLGVRERMMLASDQLGHSLRQLYASASSITDVPPSYHNIPGIVPYYHGRTSGPPPSYEDVVNPHAAPPTYQSLFGQMREARKTSRGLLDLMRRLLIILISTLGCTILIAFMILIPFTMILVGAIYIDECRVERIPAFLFVGGLIWASKNIIHCYSQCQPENVSINSATNQAMGAASLDMSDASSVSSTGSRNHRQQQNQNLHQHDQQQPNHSSQDITTSASREIVIGLSPEAAPPGATTNSNNNNDGSNRQVASTTIATSFSSSSSSSSAEYRTNIDPSTSAQQRRMKISLYESILNCLLLGWFIIGCIIVFQNYEPDFKNTSSARYCNKTVYMYTFWLITSALMILGFFIGCICCLMVSSAISGRQDDNMA